MTDTIAETERLIIRQWRHDDFADWSRHLNTDEVRVHLGGAVPPDKAQAAFDRTQATWAREGYGFLAVVRKEDGMLLGNCGMGPIATEQAPDGLRGEFEVGYQFRTDAAGAGYATEAARAMVGITFAKFERPTVFAQTSQANHRSWKLMKRLGMTRRADLDYVDPAYPAEENPTMVWSIAREDWDR